jgi:hypothetical protein
LANQSVTDDWISELIGGLSPLDRPLDLTLFSSVTDQGKKDGTLSLRELAALVHSPERSSKSELPLIKLARFGDDRNGGMALRNDANVLCFIPRHCRLL